MSVQTLERRDSYATSTSSQQHQDWLTCSGDGGDEAAAAATLCGMYAEVRSTHDDRDDSLSSPYSNNASEAVLCSMQSEGVSAAAPSFPCIPAAMGILSPCSQQEADCRMSVLLTVAFLVAQRDF